MKRAAVVVSVMAQEMAELLCNIAEKRQDEEERIQYWRHSLYWSEKAGESDLEQINYLDDLDRKNPEHTYSWREQTEVEIAEMVCDLYQDRIEAKCNA